MKLPFTPTRTFLGLCLGASIFALTAQQQAPPPEVSELQAVMQMEEIPARIKELQRIKAAYPDSAYGVTINAMLLQAVTQNADSLDKVLAAQAEIINSPGKAQDRLTLLVNGVNFILDHPKAGDFPKPAFSKAIQDYRTEGLKLLNSSEFKESIPEDRRSMVIERNQTIFDIPLAKAYLMVGDAQTALDTLNKFGETERDARWYNALGETYLDMKRDSEALSAFFDAAKDDHRDAIASAKALYIKTGGSEAAFETELERRQAQLPFQPPPFTPPANWKGKTALVEVFTGSECPPCVAAGFAFDGLKEAYPAQYLAILKYHVPIPGPDPMMNPTTKARSDFYNIRSAPTMVIEGVKPLTGGGPRAAALGTFNRIKAEIDPVLETPAEITIKATAALSGDTVKVDCEFSKVIENAEYNVVLVQSEEKYKGGNGYTFHKMVVRELKTATPSDKATVTFNIPESEKATDEYLSEFEKTLQARPRTADWTWPARQNKIGRDKLKAVVFVQDKETKQVHNAFVADVK